MVTPGFRLVFECEGQGQQHEYHTEHDDSKVAGCEVTSPSASAPNPTIFAPNSEQIAAVLGFSFQLVLNRIGESCVCDVLPRSRRKGVLL